MSSYRNVKAVLSIYSNSGSLLGSSRLNFFVLLYIEKELSIML